MKCRSGQRCRERRSVPCLQPSNDWWFDWLLSLSLMTLGWLLGCLIIIIGVETPNQMGNQDYLWTMPTQLPTSWTQQDDVQVEAEPSVSVAHPSAPMVSHWTWEPADSNAGGAVLDVWWNDFSWFQLLGGDDCRWLSSFLKEISSSSGTEPIVITP